MSVFVDIPVVGTATCMVHQIGSSPLLPSHPARLRKSIQFAQGYHALCFRCRSDSGECVDVSSLISPHSRIPGLCSLYGKSEAKPSEDECLLPQWKKIVDMFKWKECQT